LETNPRHCRNPARNFRCTDYSLPYFASHFGKGYSRGRNIAYIYGSIEEVELKKGKAVGDHESVEREERSKS
jgi:hypothetical protein